MRQQFNLIFNESWKQLGPAVKRIAENTPGCSDHSKRIDCELRSAREYIALLLVLPLLCPARNFFCIQTLIGKIHQKAVHYQYQGDWKIVGELLQQDHFSVYQRWTTVSKELTDEEWFGNLLPLMVRVVKAIRFKKQYIFQTERSSKVRKPQRKRGYSDKGSLRPSHRWTERFLGEVEEKERIELPQRRIRGHEWFGGRRGRG